MFSQYFKQAFYLLKENKLLSFISIAGTAFSIAMIMVVVIKFRSQTASFAPEVNRERSLVFQWAGYQRRDNPNWQSNGPVSYQTAKECFKDLTIPEAVTIYRDKETMLASEKNGPKMSCDVQQTDEAFWQIFEFAFVTGKPYDLADFESGLAKAVISEAVAREVFGTTDAVGRSILLNHTEYIVCGVVKNVSMLADKAYAQVWIPMSSTNALTDTWADGVMGDVRVVILARSKADFPAIREESEMLRKKYSESLPHHDMLFRDQPDTYFVASLRTSANNYPRVKEAVRMHIIIIIVLLLVPAINLSGLTLSRMRKRLSEIGLRKAFGASRNELMIQILSENMLYSILGGIFGLILSYIGVYFMADMLFGSSWNSSLQGENQLSATFLLSPTVFFLAFLFCFVLNLLSAGIPAWRTSRKNITDSLNS